MLLLLFFAFVVAIVVGDFSLPVKKYKWLIVVGEGVTECCCCQGRIFTVTKNENLLVMLLL